MAYNYSKKKIMYDYSKKDLVIALKKVGLKKNDIIICHSNVSRFGLPKGGLTKKNIYRTIFKAFFEVISSTGTLIIPTFTYSFSKGEIYDPLKSKNICGLFSEEFQKQKNIKRYLDPNQSFLVYGKYKKFFCSKPSLNSYDDNSMWARLLKKNSKICNLNLNAGSTFIHYVEKKIGVSYRFDKTFTGIIKDGNKNKKSKSTLFVGKRNRKQNLAQFEIFTNIAKKKNFYKTSKVGKGFVGLISCKKTFNLIAEEIKKNPFFLTESDKRYKSLKKNNVN